MRYKSMRLNDAYYEGVEDAKKTLRDEFAGRAMQGILSNPSMIDSIEPTSADWISERSYEIAYQMMEARK